MTHDNQENVIFIDKEKFKIESSEMSVRDIIETLAGENPDETILVLKHRNELTEYSDLNQLIALSNGMKFIIYHNTPTTVS